MVALDVDSRELLALEASYCRSCLNALKFIKKVLKFYTNKSKIMVDRGSENTAYVERFFRYLEERTAIFLTS
ncbi:MAG: hypothetical protein QXU63_01965 [Nitrososphaerota archaeon]